MINNVIPFQPADVQRFNNFYQRVQDSIVDNSWTAFGVNEIDFGEDFAYRVLFDNDGNFKDDGTWGDVSLSSGTLGNFNGWSNAYFMPQMKNFYIIIKSYGSNSSSVNLSLKTPSYFELNNPDDSIDINFSSNTDMFFTGNDLRVYKVSWDTDLKYFTDKYGIAYSNDGYGWYFDENIFGSMAIENDDTTTPNLNYSFAVYTEDVLNKLVSNATAYNNAYNNGYNQGYNVGYGSGRSNTIENEYNGQNYNTIRQNAINEGYAQGQASVSVANATIMGLFGSIANVPITILNGVFAPTILGVPIVSVLLTFLSILVVLWLIHKFMK